ncbi:MAG: PilZ domain-containing protein [Candidatus Omnitrophica bacterium]|nr:PilZ domain-containing protein [Candidatus Omnitrophota bacterium]
MNIILVCVLTAVVFFVIYILSSREDRKINEKYATRGKVEEYCAGEKERRRCERFDTELDLKYNLIPASRSDFMTNTKNISKSGISILVYEILPKDSLIDMEISVPNSKETIKLRGKVAWCEGCNGIERLDKDGKRTFLVGIEFLETEKKHQNMLMEYIDKHLSVNKKGGNDGSTKRAQD